MADGGDANKESARPKRNLFIQIINFLVISMLPEKFFPDGAQQASLFIGKFIPLYIILQFAQLAQ